MDNYLIMVIDDDETVREAMQALLDCYGSKTLAAESAELALEQLSKESRLPDLLLVDYRLRDGVTGDQAIDKVRSALGEPIPSIIITGDTSSQSLEHVNQSGCRVLNKPLPTDELLQNIDELVG